MDYLDFLYASDGTGEAVRAVVTGTRTSGATTLEVDSLNNWPTKFVATVGTLNESTGIIDPATVTVFKGHSSGGDIIIDQIAPGYVDDGNTVGQVVVLKPATFWVDTLAAGLAVFFNTDGTPKNNSVPNSAIQNNAVTTPKIANDAVTPEKRSGGFAVGTFNSNSSTITINTLDFEPKIIRFTLLRDDGAYAIYSTGTSLGTTNHFGSSIANRITGSGTTGTRSKSSTTSSIVMAHNQDNTFLCEGKVTATNSTGFVVTMTTPFNVTWGYEAYA